MTIVCKTHELPKFELITSIELTGYDLESCNGVELVHQQIEPPYSPPRTIFENTLQKVDVSEGTLYAPRKLTQYSWKFDDNGTLETFYIYTNLEQILKSYRAGVGFPVQRRRFCGAKRRIRDICI